LSIPKMKQFYDDLLVRFSRKRCALLLPVAHGPRCIRLPKPVLETTRKPATLSVYPSLMWSSRTHLRA
jgi:hypothetical protein